MKVESLPEEQLTPGSIRNPVMTFFKAAIDNHRSFRSYKKGIMRIRQTLIVLILLSTPFVANAQDAKRVDGAQYVIAPAENTLLTIASQPNCPLSIDNAKVLLNIDTSWAFKFSYDLRNHGDKSIRSFTIHFWTSEGTGGTLSTQPLKVGPISKGEKITAEEFNVVPLTDALRTKLGLGIPMKMVVILMVENIRFADGS